MEITKIINWIEIKKKEFPTEKDEKTGKEQIIIDPKQISIELQLPPSSLLQSLYLLSELTQGELINTSENEFNFQLKLPIDFQQKYNKIINQNRNFSSKLRNFLLFSFNILFLITKIFFGLALIFSITIMLISILILIIIMISKRNSRNSNSTPNFPPSFPPNTPYFFPPPYYYFLFNPIRIDPYPRYSRRIIINNNNNNNINNNLNNNINNNINNGGDDGGDDDYNNNNNLNNNLNNNNNYPTKYKNLNIVLNFFIDIFSSVFGDEIPPNFDHNSRCLRAVGYFILSFSFVFLIFLNYLFLYIFILFIYFILFII